MQSVGVTTKKERTTGQERIRKETHPASCLREMGLARPFLLLFALLLARPRGRGGPRFDYFVRLVIPLRRAFPCCRAHASCSQAVRVESQYSVEYFSVARRKIRCSCRHEGLDPP